MAMQAVEKNNAKTHVPFSNYGPRTSGHDRESDELIAIRLAIEDLGVDAILSESRDRNVHQASQNQPVISRALSPGYDGENDEQLAIQLALEDLGIDADLSGTRERNDRHQTSLHQPSGFSGTPSFGYDSESDELLAIQLTFEDLEESTVPTPIRDVSNGQRASQHRPKAPSSGHNMERDELLALKLAMVMEDMDFIPTDDDTKGAIGIHETKDHQAPQHRHESPLRDSSSGHERYTSASSTYRSRPFEESTDKMPQLFLIVPALEDPIIDKTYRPFRILTPCQAPSILKGGDEDSIHLTHHEGYTIKNPKEIIHKCRDFINFLDAISPFFFVGAAAAAIAHGFSINPNDLPNKPLSGFNRMAHNKVHMRRAGVQSQLYFKQRVLDNHQIDAMITLFRSAGFADNNGNMRFTVRPIHFGGPTKWVCEECYQLLSQNRTISAEHHMTLKEYAALTKRATDAEVILRCSASVITFTKTILSHPQVRRAIIQIESGYFQTAERQSGTQYDAIQNQFVELGKALQLQPLTSLEIRGDHECGSVFIGLQHVL
ncbi:hypothetical protein BGZ65_002895, partial [Modicella reniformis]